MNICSEHGDDIAFAGRDCPACGHIEELREDIEQLGIELKELEEKE